MVVTSIREHPESSFSMQPSAAKPRRRAAKPSTEAQARIRQAEAMERLAGSIEEATLKLGPAAEAVANLSDAQKKLCNFILNNRLKIAAGIPAMVGLIGVFVNALSPAAAELLGAFLKGAGLIG